MNEVGKMEWNEIGEKNERVTLNNVGQEMNERKKKRKKKMNFAGRIFQLQPRKKRSAVKNNNYVLAKI